MEEKHYRESRLCRMLGNPVVYQLVVLLERGGPLTPSKMAQLIGRQISTISIHLAKLRNADVVRCKPGMIFSEIGLIPFLVPAHRRKRIPPMVRTLAAPCEV